MKMKYKVMILPIVICVAAQWALLVHAQQAVPTVVKPAKMQKMATVDPRYLSFNVEMVEVTGGRFWKPYKAPGGLYQSRPPIDLTNPRLRNLASALAPSYMRVSGTWQNSTWFQDDDKPARTEPPAGFQSVLTRAEWKGVVDFAHAVDAQIVTSFAFSSGTRTSDGLWTDAQAKAWLDYTHRLGSRIAAAEFMNEPNYSSQGGAPRGYDAVQFGQDVKVFREFLRKAAPDTIFLGPGSSSEGISLLPAGSPVKVLATEDLLKATGPVFDGLSYHFYGAISHRCLGKTAIADTVTANWLDRTETVYNYYQKARDKYLPGKPLWLTETGEAGCGGDEFAAQFADSFRFLNQLGTLAQKGVRAVMHNTLAAGDYSLLEPATLTPRPNYWAAILWKRLMGPTVLDPGTTSSSDLRLYAQCTPGKRRSVTLLALNLSQTNEQSLSLPSKGVQYTLSADGLDSPTVQLNGAELKERGDGGLPNFIGVPVTAGRLQLKPLTITFVAIPNAHNPYCQK